MTQTTKPKDEVAAELLYRNDYVWSQTDEPHMRRKKELLSKYGDQIKKLHRIDPATKYKCLALVLLQVAACYVACLPQVPWWLFILMMWGIGGSLNHSITVGIHEVTHNVAFEKVIHNLYLAIFTNMPMGIPYAVSFMRYHHEHHNYQGVVGIDTDIGTPLEGRLMQTKLGKFIHIFFMSIFYSIRPLIIAPKMPTLLDLLNLVVEATFMIGMYLWLGIYAPIYFVGSTFLGLGLHPLSGHFIGEHFLKTPNQETHSYYGPANWFMFNVGYHNEHHDFPRIPGSLLPELKRIAPEYYDNLLSYTSWTKVIYDYIMTDGYSPFDRVMRTLETHKKSRKGAKGCDEDEEKNCDN